MDDGEEVCCDTETLECHNWLESECVLLAQRYVNEELKGFANGVSAENPPLFAKELPEMGVETRQMRVFCFRVKSRNVDAKRS